MGRTKQRNRPKVERANIALPQSSYGGGQGSITIPASMLMQIMSNNAPQSKPAEMFSPGAPLEPIKGVTPVAGPRQWAYPIGVNLSGVDRTLGIRDIPSFQQLRTLATSYSGINLAERVWCDLIPRMQLKITLHKYLVAQGMEDKNFQKEIMQYTSFFERPDGFDDYHVWIRKAIVDQTQVDGLVLYKRRTRGGKLLGLDVVDPATIKPLLDERGRLPDPPFPCFQQYPYGVPGEFYTSDQMIYYRESPRSFTPYGFSRVERIMLNVNQALRKQQQDLARWTEGNMPAGIMEVPDTSSWTPDQIDMYETMWNALIAGNPQQQVRVKFTQPGFKYNRLDTDPISTDFDKFLLNLTLSSYGLSMADVGFTEEIHKSSDAGQQNMLYRRTIDPIAISYGRILTSVLRDDFHDNRFQVTFGGYNEEEDFAQEVSAVSTAVKNGLISPKDAAKRLGFPDVPDTGPLYMIATGAIPLSNYEIGSPARAAIDKAVIAGAGQPGAPPTTGQAPTGNPAGPDQPAAEPDSDANRAAILDDFRKWRDVALKDIKSSKPIRTFVSSFIPMERYTAVAAALLQCATAYEVREVFNRVEA